MTQEPRNLINLSVHESSDPSLISPNPDAEASGDLKELNDSVHDHENVDVANPQPFDDASDENSGHSQTTIANLSSG